MITVYHLLHSRSERVIWLLEELGQPYELQIFAREASGAAPAAYRALHPVGTAPVMRDGELLLVETGGILEHVLDRYGGGRLTPPRKTDDYSRYAQWMHFAEGSMAAAILSEALGAREADPAKPPSPVQQMWRGRNIRTLRWLDSELSRRPYIAGEAFTAADIMISFNFGLYERFAGGSLADFAAIRSYLETIQARPAYQKAMSIAHPQDEPAAPSP